MGNKSPFKPPESHLALAVITEATKMLSAYLFKSMQPIWTAGTRTWFANKL